MTDREFLYYLLGKLENTSDGGAHLVPKLISHLSPYNIDDCKQKEELPNKIVIGGVTYEYKETQQKNSEKE